MRTSVASQVLVCEELIAPLGILNRGGIVELILEAAPHVAAGALKILFFTLYGGADVLELEDFPAVVDVLLMILCFRPRPWPPCFPRPS